MPNNRLQITLEILTQQANSALAATTASSKRMRDQFIQTGTDSDKSVKALSSDLSKMGTDSRQALQILGHQAEISAQDLQALDNTAKTSEQQLRMFATGGKEGRDALASLGNSAGLSQDQISRMTNALSNGEREMERTEVAAQGLSIGMNLADRALGKLADAAGFSQEPIVKVVSAFDDLGSRATSAVSQGLDKVKEGFQELAPSGFYLDKIGKGMEFVAEKTANLSPSIVRLSEKYLGLFPPMVSLQTSLAGGLVKVAQIATSAANAFQGMVDEFKSNPFVEKAIAAQRMQTSLKSLMGSMDAAGDRIKELGVIADKTPFEMHSIVEGEIQLRSFQQSAERFLPVAVTLASVTGRDVPDAALALGEALSGVSTGVTMLQRSFRITRQDLKGAGADLDAVGQISNKTVTNMEHLANAIEKVTNQKFGNVVAEQSKTLGGALSTMEDAFHRLETGIGTALAPLAIEMVKLVNSGISMAQAYLPAFQDMVKYMTELYHVAAPAVELFLKFKYYASNVVEAAVAVTVLTKVVKLYAAAQEAAALGMTGFAGASVALRVALGGNSIALQSGKLFLDRYVAGTVASAAGMNVAEDAAIGLTKGLTETAVATKTIGGTILSMGARSIAAAGGMAALTAATATAGLAIAGTALYSARIRQKWDEARDSADQLSHAMSEVNNRGHENQEVIGKSAEELVKVGATTAQVTTEILALQQRLGEIKADPQLDYHFSRILDIFVKLAPVSDNLKDKILSLEDNLVGIEHVHVDNPFSDNAIKKTEEMEDALKGVRKELPALQQANHQTTEQIMNDASHAADAWIKFEKDKRFHAFNTVKEESDALDKVYDDNVKALAKLDALEAAHAKTARPGNKDDTDLANKMKARGDELRTQLDQEKEQKIAANRSALEAQWSYEQAHFEKLVRMGQKTTEQLMAFQEAQAADPKYKQLEDQQRDAKEENAAKEIEWSRKVKEMHDSEAEAQTKSDTIAITKINEQIDLGNDLVKNKAALMAKTKEYYDDQIADLDRTTEDQAKAAASEAERNDIKTLAFEKRKQLLEEQREAIDKVDAKQREADSEAIKDVQMVIESRSKLNAVILEGLNKKQELGFDVSGQIDGLKKVEQEREVQALKAQMDEELLSDKAVHNAEYAARIKEKFENEISALAFKHQQEDAEREIANIKRVQEKRLAGIENEKAALENKMAKLEEEDSFGVKTAANENKKIAAYGEELEILKKQLDAQEKIEEAGVDLSKRAQIEAKYRNEREKAEIDSNKKIQDAKLAAIEATAARENSTLEVKKAMLQEELDLGVSGVEIHKRQIKLVQEELRIKKEQLEAQEKIAVSQASSDDKKAVELDYQNKITLATIEARKAIEDMNKNYTHGDSILDKQLKKIERIKKLLGEKTDKEDDNADPDTYDTDKDSLRLLLQREQAAASATQQQQTQNALSGSGSGGGANLGGGPTPNLGAGTGGGLGGLNSVNIVNGENAAGKTPSPTTAMGMVTVLDQMLVVLKAQLKLGQQLQGVNGDPSSKYSLISSPLNPGGNP